MSLVKRKIEVTIILAEGKFSATGTSEITLKDLRVSANIISYNGDAQGQLHLQIWGLPLSTINELTAIGPIRPQTLNNNKIIVSAGDEGGPMSIIYQGVILSGFGDFQAIPEVAFNIFSLSAAFDAVNSADSKTYSSATPASEVFQALANEMGLAFENHGVEVILPQGTYFSGSTLTQVKECAAAANVYYSIDRGKLAIWPKNGFKKDEPIKIGPDSGMVGYPAFASAGLVITTLFNPNLSLGGRVEIESSLTAARGVWCVYRVAHSIESEMLGGGWFSQIMCYRIEWITGAN